MDEASKVEQSNSAAVHLAQMRRSESYRDPRSDLDDAIGRNMKVFRGTLRFARERYE